jgi:hypothetical protein
MYPFTAFLVLITAATCYAQDASWLKRTWEGRAYLLGANPENYNLELTVYSVKGKNFEGVMKTIQPSDPSIHFDTKISGTVRDRQVVINIGTWKVKCNTCKPQTLGYSIESGRFFLKGEAKGCSIECTWIAEFSEEIDKFNGSQKDELYALAEEQAPETDTAAVVQNTKPVVSPVETTLPTERIPLLPAGSVAVIEHNTALQVTQKPPASLDKTLSISIPQNAPPEQRTAVLPAGDIATSGHDTTLQLSQKTSASLDKTLSVSIPQNAPPEQRVAVLAAGSIVSSEHHTVSGAPQKPPGALPDKNSSLTIKKNTPVSVKKSLDTASALPEGYAERKKNVIRTLIVNTDSILLRVYDNGVVDGDIASVIYNDRVVVDKLSLTSRALEIKIPVSKSGINTLVFHAHNLGEFPPNTAKLEILYGNKREELTVSSDLTVSSTIDIEYRQ